MASSFRGTPRNEGRSSKETHRLYEEPVGDGFDEDEAAEAMAAHPETSPSLKLIIGIFNVGVGASTNVVQVTTTTLAIISLILGSQLSIKTSSVGMIVQAFPWYCLIGLVISLGIQGFLHKNAQPAEATWHRLRDIAQTKHAVTNIKNTVTFNTIYFLVALGADVISDATFINLFTRNPIVILFWIVFLTGSSTLLLYDGWSRVAQAIELYQEYKAYNMERDAWADGQ